MVVLIVLLCRSKSKLKPNKLVEPTLVHSQGNTLAHIQGRRTQRNIVNRNCSESPSPRPP